MIINKKFVFYICIFAFSSIHILAKKINTGFMLLGYHKISAKIYNNKKSLNIVKRSIKNKRHEWNVYQNNFKIDIICNQHIHCRYVVSSFYRISKLLNKTFIINTPITIKVTILIFRLKSFQ